MFTDADKRQIESRGMSVARVEHQVEQIKQGFPFLRLEGAASVEKGIMVLDEESQNKQQKIWEDYKKSKGHRVVKFVPASGAASRMFKNMFAFLTADYDVPTTDFEKKYFAEIKHFAFYDMLNKMC